MDLIIKIPLQFTELTGNKKSSGFLDMEYFKIFLPNKYN